jgi:hypothetical protein
MIEIGAGITIGGGIIIGDTPAFFTTNYFITEDGNQLSTEDGNKLIEE